jgi:hypothetical protein
MGRPKKDPSQVRSVPLNFRVSSAVKEAIDVMVQRRAIETGDDSITGWFLALVHREAKRLGVEIGTAPATKPSPRTKRPTASLPPAPGPKSPARGRG